MAQDRHPGGAVALPEAPVRGQGGGAVHGPDARWRNAATMPLGFRVTMAAETLSALSLAVSAGAIAALNPCGAAALPVRVGSTDQG